MKAIIYSNKKKKLETYWYTYERTMKEGQQDFLFDKKGNVLQ